MTDTDNVQLLLAYYDEKKTTPVLQNGLADDATSAGEKEKGVEPKFLRGESEDPGSLPIQRWGVVVPDGDLGDRLLAAMDPLIQRRAEQQGNIKPIVYRVPNASLSMDEAMAWREREYQNLHLPPGKRISEEDQPAYLMILGDLHQVPDSVRQVQALDCFIGRVAFSTPTGEPDFARYEAYANKVVRWEKNPTAVRPRAQLAVVRDGTPATEAALYGLIEPALGLSQEDARLGRFPGPPLGSVADVTVPDVDAFLAMTQSAEPTVLLSVSHGSGPPKGGWQSPERKLLLQGSMKFVDGKLAAADLGEQAFLPGGIWFMLACYGAGTPHKSEFRHWLEQLRNAKKYSGNVDAVLEGLPRGDERPFIAALPQQALANPNGPLAFVGHLDLAWTYSFQDLDSGGPRSQPARFTSLLKSLLRRNRIGVALREILRYIGSANTQLGFLYNTAAEYRTETDARRLGHVWMARQDLLGYVLLGDPAVHLPVPGKDEAGKSASPPAVRPATPQVTTSSPTPPPAAASAGLSAMEAMVGGASSLRSRPAEPAAPASPPPSPERLAQIERRILQVLGGQLTADDVAPLLGMTAAQLGELVKAYGDAGRAAVTRKLS